MRWFRPIALGLTSLALGLPATRADQPAPPDPNAEDAHDHHHHRGLFWRREETQAPHLCADCQRKLMMQQQQVAVAAGVPMMAPGNGQFCAECQGRAMVPGQAVIVGPPVIMEGGQVIGQPVVNGGAAPGYAVVGGPAPAAEPAPIGVMQASFRPANDPAGTAVVAPPGRALADRSAEANSAQADDEGPFHRRAPRPGPASQMGTHPARHRARVWWRSADLPVFGRRHQARLDRERQKHASIAYDPAAATVSQLPASMVYGGR